MNKTKSMDEGYYLCNPKRNTSCSKEECFMNGGPCMYTCHKEFSKDIPSNKEKAVDVLKSMDDDSLAEILAHNVFICDVCCPVQEQGKCSDLDICCEQTISRWLKED